MRVTASYLRRKVLMITPLAEATVRNGACYRSQPADQRPETTHRASYFIGEMLPEPRRYLFTAVAPRAPAALRRRDYDANENAALTI